MGIRITSSPALAVPSFSAKEMQDIAQVAVQEESQRTARGINSDDGPAKSLSLRYAKQKTKAGAHPIRDLRLTGEMMASRGVLESAENVATVGFRDQRAYVKAAVNESLEPMLGISPTDQAAVDVQIRTVFDGNLKELSEVTNAGILVQAIVDKYRDIPELVTELANEPNSVIPYFDRYATVPTIIDAIYKVPQPGILVCWLGRQPVRQSGEFIVREHEFAMYIRLREIQESEDGDAAYTLLDLLEDGVPANGDSLPMLYTSIHDSCDPIGDPMRVNRVSTPQGLDYFEARFSLRERSSQ